MDYKAFVSSTFLDLKDHRAHVIRELRKAGFFVDPMEEWTSAAQEPKVLSTNPVEPGLQALCALGTLGQKAQSTQVSCGDSIKYPGSSDE